MNNNEIKIMVGNFVPLGTCYSDYYGIHRYFPIVHITRETKKSYLTTDYRLNHGGPDKFKTFEEQQRWIRKEKLNNLVKDASFMADEPWTMNYVSFSEEELKRIHSTSLHQ